MVRLTVLPMSIRFWLLGSMPIGALLACDKGGDSAGSETDADTDTDSDSDTDSDTDTDTDTDADTDTDTDTDSDSDADTDTGPSAEGWDADAIMVDASFGYDATTGELLAISNGKTSYEPVVYFGLLNYDDWWSPSPSQYCFVGWDVAGVPTPAAGFSDFWMSIDLVGVPMTFDDPHGFCEGMSTIFGDARGAKESLEDFIDSQDFAFGIHSLADVDPITCGRWVMHYGIYGGRCVYMDFMAAGAFSSSLTKWEPLDADVMLAYEVDSSTWPYSLVGWHDVSSVTTLPTGFYDLDALHIYGSGF